MWKKRVDIQSYSMSYTFSPSSHRVGGTLPASRRAFRQDSSEGNWIGSLSGVDELTFAKHRRTVEGMECGKKKEREDEEGKLLID